MEKVQLVGGVHEFFGQAESIFIDLGELRGAGYVNWLKVVEEF
jgi:hypothetical protein